MLELKSILAGPQDLLPLPKQVYQYGTGYSNIWAYVGHSYSNCQEIIQRVNFLLPKASDFGHCCLSVRKSDGRVSAEKAKLNPQYGATSYSLFPSRLILSDHVYYRQRSLSSYLGQPVWMQSTSPFTHCSCGGPVFTGYTAPYPLCCSPDRELHT